MGISHIEPNLLPEPFVGLWLIKLTVSDMPKLLKPGKQPLPVPLQRLLGTGLAGALPIEVRSLTNLLLTASSIPVKPHPDAPPLVVKIVTGSPINLYRWRTRESLLLHDIALPPFLNKISIIMSIISYAIIQKMTQDLMIYQNQT